VLSGCTTSPGAAAVIGSTRITTGQLQSEVTTSLADPAVRAALANSQTAQALGGSRVGFTRQTLSRLINERLYAVVAAEHHVTVTAAQISAQQASYVQEAGGLTQLQQSAASQVGVSASQLGELVRFTVLQKNLGSALTANLTATHAQLKEEYKTDIDNYDKLDIAQIAVQSKSLAEKILHRVRRTPSSFAAQAAKYSIDTSTKNSGGKIGLVGRSEVQSALGGAAASAKPGTFQLATTNGQYVVLHIISRQRQPLSQVTAQVKTALFASKAQSLIESAVVAEGTKLGVHVSPRYGRWDNTTQTVVAATNPVSSPG
jgi:parvulin-like peptidyl-prolyl isomerase